MKKTGLILIIIGIIFTLITALNISFRTEEEVAEVGPFELTREEEHDVGLSPWYGIGAIFVGGVLFLVGRKK